jgi:hypothetical protein
MRRKGADGWAYQGFNVPKSTWGGQLRVRMRKLEGEQRAAMYKTMGGTNTPVRRSWQEQLARGRAQGWYRPVIGVIDAMRPAGELVEVTASTDQGPQQGTFDAVVDCTGLEADVREHRVLADLLDHSNAGRNVLGRLDVEASFELRGTRSGTGRLYASGSATQGGYFPGVDSFLGLLVAAQEITDDLVQLGFAQQLTPGRSTGQWWKWVRNRTI